MLSSRLGVVLLALGPVASTRCAKEEPAAVDDTCPTELADLQTAFDDLTAACTPGPITRREGGLLVADDAGAVLSVPPGALAADTTFTITPVDKVDAVAELGSAIYDISGNEVTTFDEPVTICLKSSSSAEGSCLGYLDTSGQPAAWRCQDECLQSHDDLLCGETNHLTNFAILLGSGGGGGSKCGSDESLLTRREGGVVRSKDGVAFVSVPPGALEVDTSFQITPGTAPKNDKARLTEVYSFEPNGVKFSEPAWVCLGGAPVDSKAGCLGYIDETVDPPKWVCEDPCVKRVDGTVCGQTSHFTSFAILLDGGLSDLECGRK